MNSKIQKINEEDVLFIDAEVVRRSKELEIDSTEYSLFQKKTRNRDTDEFLTDEELVQEYNKKAALKMGYGKVVSIGVGFIKEGVPYIKDLSGEEDEIIKDFCTIASQFDYVCGANILGYDLPIVTNSGWRYYKMTDFLPDRFVVSGKKPWNLDSCIDLMGIFKATHYANSSVEEMCYHFDIPTPKDDISGAEVSQTYWYGDRERIYTYVKKDVFANINIFRKMQGKDIFEDFVDRSNTKVKDERTVLQKLYDSEELTDTIKKELEAVLSKKKITKKDKDNLFKILLSVYQKKGERKQEKLDKEAEIKQFLDEI